MNPDKTKSESARCPLESCTFRASFHGLLEHIFQARDSGHQRLGNIMADTVLRPPHISEQSNTPLDNLPAHSGTGGFIPAPSERSFSLPLRSKLQAFIDAGVEGPVASSLAAPQSLDVNPVASEVPKIQRTRIDSDMARLQLVDPSISDQNCVESDSVKNTSAPPAEVLAQLKAYLKGDAEQETPAHQNSVQEQWVYSSGPSYPFIDFGDLLNKHTNVSNGLK